MLRCRIFSLIVSEHQLPAKPTSLICKAADVVSHYMAEHDFGICDGFVYRKPSEAKYTYIFTCTVETFLLQLIELNKNVKLSDAVTPVVDKLINLLSKPKCRLIKPMSIDHNYIEVLPYGRCFNIEKKCFEMDPQMNGSPRAYVLYRRDEKDIPFPKFFVEGSGFF